MTVRTTLSIVGLLAAAALPLYAAEPAAPPAAKPAVSDPSKANEKAPDTFKAKFETSKGIFVVEFHRDWSPNGVDRVYNLFRTGFYNNARFFRVVPGFVVQFGIPADPAVGRPWMRATIADDPLKESNKKGYITFAKGGPNSRSTQLFINLEDNQRLDSMGFPPLGKVVQGMDVVLKLNGEYGEGLTNLQGQIWEQGNAFLNMKAPRLDYITKVSVE